MKNRLGTLLQFSIFWLTFFIVGKLIFTVLNYSVIEDLYFIDVLKSFVVGLKLDLSFLGYILVLPFVLFIIDSLYPNKLTQPLFSWYCYLLIVVFGLVIIIDSVLYQHWGIKLDVDPLKYINQPGLIVGNLSILSLLFDSTIYIVFIFLSLLKIKME